MKRLSKYQKLAIGGALSLLVFTALGAGLASQASAYQGNPDERGPNYNPERHEQMENAFNNNDYNAWKSLMEEMVQNRSNRGARVLEVVNADNFSKFAEAYRLAQEGKLDEANAIRAELGLGNGLGRGANAGQRGANRSGTCNCPQS